MSSTFARLFRNSKFASLDPQGRQVLTTTKALRAKGVWGLKSNLPKDFSTPVITVNEHDDENGIMHFKGAFEQVAAVERWKELFPLPLQTHPLPKVLEEKFINEIPPPGVITNSLNIATNTLSSAFTIGTDSTSDSLSTEHNDISIEMIEQTRATLKPIDLAKATPEERQEIVERACRMRKVFKKLVDQRRYGPKDWPQFLKVETSKTSYHRSKGSEWKHPPVYRTRDPNSPLMSVKGRILNALPNNAGYAVGIAGYVAYIPQHETVSFVNNKNRTVILDFYVLDARVTEEGKPEVIVSLKAPDNTARNKSEGDDIQVFFEKIQNREEDKIFKKNDNFRKAMTKPSSQFSFRDFTNKYD